MCKRLDLFAQVTSSLKLFPAHKPVESVAMDILGPLLKAGAASINHIDRGPVHETVPGRVTEMHSLGECRSSILGTRGLEVWTANDNTYTQ